MGPSFGWFVGFVVPVQDIFLLPWQHCKEIWIYVFPEKELRGLSPNFHIHVSVSDQYIPMYGPSIFLQ
jgi:hypothetical protein